MFYVYISDDDKQSKCCPANMRRQNLEPRWGGGHYKSTYWFIKNKSDEFFQSLYNANMLLA